MKENSILPIMVKEHCKIEKFIDKLEENINKDNKEFEKLFNIFEIELKNHISIEENAIFKFYNPGNISIGYKMLPDLMKQHNFILNNLSNIKKYYIKNKKIEGFYEFKNSLLNHRKFEEKEVYRQLDRELNNEQKNLIIKNILEYL
jgi:hemerythrin-like domain-containing protein